jgi:hypothetical protein
MGLSTMESGYLDSHNLGHGVRKIMLALEVSKSQQCALKKTPAILATPIPAADQAWGPS